jgi:hypothetical protein
MVARLVDVGPDERLADAAGMSGEVGAEAPLDAQHPEVGRRLEGRRRSQDDPVAHVQVDLAADAAVRAGAADLAFSRNHGHLAGSTSNISPLG